VDYFGEERGGRLWDRFTVHYTPKHGSWLNQAEIELSMFSRQCVVLANSDLVAKVGLITHRSTAVRALDYGAHRLVLRLFT